MRSPCIGKGLFSTDSNFKLVVVPDFCGIWYSDFMGVNSFYLTLCLYFFLEISDLTSFLRDSGLNYEPKPSFSAGFSTPQTFSQVEV